MTDDPNPDLDDGFEYEPPSWRCQECFHRPTWKLPADRAAYYARRPEGRKCPKCRSFSCAPEGW